jgi:hypothetical protein
MLIDGKQVPAAWGKVLAVYNPATGGVIANLPAAVAELESIDSGKPYAVARVVDLPLGRICSATSMLALPRQYGLHRSFRRNSAARDRRRFGAPHFFLWCAISRWSGTQQLAVGACQIVLSPSHHPW